MVWTVIRYLPPALFGLLQLVGCSSSQQASHLVLVSQAGSSTVAVIDPVQGRTVKRITVGGLPHRMILNPDGSKVYVVLVGSQAVAEVDVRSLEVFRTFLTAPVPERRSDGTLIQPHFDQDAFSKTSCFACHNPGGAKPFIVGERPVGIAFSSDLNKLYVSHIRQGRLSEIDLLSAQVVRARNLPPSGAASEAVDVARVGSRLVVAMRPRQPSTEASAVRWLDEQTWQTLSEAPTGSDPAFVLPLEENALVSNFESNTLSLHAPASSPKSFTVTPGPLGMLKVAEGRVLSLNYYSNAVSLVDLVSGQVQNHQLELGSRIFVNPTHAALSPDGRLAYIVSSGTEGHLVVFDLERKGVTRAIPIDGLSFDVVVVRR
ncbi:YncE family protein [uncultured Meiothermus sp.]|jgi:DNA-binding beta-propeller fold protein YncE|uniref:YncE family protein n=1 Tax=uncultured Meiothermus sp. TaxID=157471 RepID=UPI00263863D8|nr:YncE family protein [uncultured Meiothermus sp.]